MSAVGKKESRDSLIDYRRQSSKESQDLSSNVNDLKRVQKHKAINQKVFNFPNTSGVVSKGLELHQPSKNKLGNNSGLYSKSKRSLAGNSG